MGDIVYFLKNEDAPEKGIMYAEMLKKRNSNDKVRILGGEDKIIPYQRVRLFVPGSVKHDQSMEELTSEERELTDRLSKAMAGLKNQL